MGIAIKQAEQILLDKGLDKEYAGITGLPDFTKSAGELAYGENSALIKDKRVCIVYSTIMSFILIILLWLPC